MSNSQICAGFVIRRMTQYYNLVYTFVMDNYTYKDLQFRFAGKSGLRIPIVSLGLWNNFSAGDDYNNIKKMLHTAFDLGITHFNLANNYGPPPGSAETNFGKVLSDGLGTHRDQIIVASKAGFGMWEGPYGDGGSRKYLIASIDQSLKRTGLNYFDIFYHHRPDYDTPMEEIALTLDRIVRDGKALYVGVSNYNGEQLAKMYVILSALKTPFIINQLAYSIAYREIEKNGAKDTAKKLGLGKIVFSPLAQGLLTDRYLNGIPKDSRAGKKLWGMGDRVTPETIAKVKELDKIAKNRNQTLAQMALSWVLKDDAITSVLIGASNPEQIKQNIQINTTFTKNELDLIDKVGINLLQIC